MVICNVIFFFGFIGIVCGLKGKEVNIFVDQFKVWKFIIFDYILEQCWDMLEDGGFFVDIYFLKGSDDVLLYVQWDWVLFGDCFVVLMQVWIVIYGFVYSFKCKCDICGEFWEYEIDLIKDFKVQNYFCEMIEVYKYGNKFSLMLLDGKSFYFKLFNGVDEKMVVK